MMTHSSAMSVEGKFFRVSKLRSLRETEQVAAVCYRIRGEDVEFLLVQTGGGRWIFPKGCVEPGLTHAQAAAMEAFEEAGVHGRIEEEPFTQYRVRRPGKQSSGKQSVSAHLCEVTRLSPPQETGRNRTWFSAEKAKRDLRKDRPQEDGGELARVVSRAAARIRRLQSQAALSIESPAKYHNPANDPLQRVTFESVMTGRSHNQVEALYMRYIRRMSGDEQCLSDGDLAVPGFQSKPRPRLGSASTPLQNVTAIDQARSPRGRY